MNVIPLDVQLFASRFAEQYSQFHGYDQDEARILFHRTRAMIHSKKNKCFRNGDVSVNFFFSLFCFSYCVNRGWHRTLQQCTC